MEGGYAVETGLGGVEAANQGLIAQASTRCGMRLKEIFAVPTLQRGGVQEGLPAAEGGTPGIAIPAGW